MNPSHDEGLHILWLPLGCSMANTVNCHKVKLSFVSLNESWNLLIIIPWCPFLDWFPIEFFDPSFRAICINESISITWVKEHSHLILEVTVYPTWSRVLNIVYFLYINTALIPCFYWISFDVHCLSCICIVNVITKSGSK